MPAKITREQIAEAVKSAWRRSSGEPWLWLTIADEILSRFLTPITDRLAEVQVATAQAERDQLGDDALWLTLERERLMAELDALRASFQDQANEPNVYVCEQHLDRLFEHDECPGPGMLLRDHLAALRALVATQGEALRAARPKWICEFCYERAYTSTLPASWDLIWQSAVCHDCRTRVEQDGGYSIVVGGAYAEVPDPRPFDATPAALRERMEAEQRVIEAAVGFANGYTFQQHDPSAATRLKRAVAALLACSRLEGTTERADEGPKD